VAGDRPNELVDRAYQVGAFADPAAAAPGAAVDRRGTIRALGIIQIVVGGISALFASFVLVTVIVSHQNPASLAASVFYGLPAVNLFVTGIGSVKIAPWARRVTIVSAGVWLGIVLLAVGGLVVAAVVTGFGVGRRELTLASAVAAPVVLVSLALPIVLIVVYTRPSVRATFERRAA
jgi:hypothetical protein